jgi:Tol biopolymer transport system component
MSLINISICLSDLPKDKIKQAGNGKKYINLVCASRKEVSQYGETHTVYVSQTKEERESGVQTMYVGAGKEYVPQPITPESIENIPTAQSNDDLPF